MEDMYSVLLFCRKDANTIQFYIFEITDALSQGWAHFLTFFTRDLGHKDLSI